MPQAAGDMVVAHQRLDAGDFNLNDRAGTSLVASVMAINDGEKQRKFLRCTATPWVLSGDQFKLGRTLSFNIPMRFYYPIRESYYFFTTSLDTFMVAHHRQVDMYDVATGEAVRWHVPDMDSIAACDYVDDTLVLYDRTQRRVRVFKPAS
jgi:hypothetical protein